MSDLDARIQAKLCELASFIEKSDPRLGKAMRITTKFYELQALLAATTRTLHIYRYLDKLQHAHVALERGNETLAQYFIGQLAA